jgi:hypothetical protein
MMVAEATFMLVLMLFFIIAEIDATAMHDKAGTAAAKGAAGLVREGKIGAGMGRGAAV